MHASTPFLLLLAGPAAAARIGVRAGAAPTDPWVTVDESGTPKTVTPVVTTISGTPTIISGAPNDLTATVFTRTSQGAVSTSTGAAPLTKDTAAAGGGGAGAFPICHAAASRAPFCDPAPGSPLLLGCLFFFTWDPTFFNGTNTTVVVAGSFFNSTTGRVTTTAFTSSNRPAAWAFYAWEVTQDLLAASPSGSVNVSISIAALDPGSKSMKPFDGPIVTVANPPTFHQAPTPVPAGPALYIGLPTVLGFVVLVAAGTCLWNHRTRRIALGNIMSRSRHGYGIGKSRSERQRTAKKEGIRLLDRDVRAAAERRYREDRGGGDAEAQHRGRQLQRPGGWDSEWDRDLPGHHLAGHDLPRRDSDALGSLAGSLTDDRQAEIGAAAGRNVFRDELTRQERERF